MLRNGERNGFTTRENIDYRKSVSCLPLFTSNSNVTADDGREDKVELTLGTWTFQATPDELDSMREYMALPPAYLREDMDSAIRNSYGYLFNRPNDPQGRRNPLHVRKSAHPRARLPEPSPK